MTVMLLIGEEETREYGSIATAMEAARHDYRRKQGWSVFQEVKMTWTFEADGSHVSTPGGYRVVLCPDDGR